MALILCIETGTDICSVGIAKDGELLSLRESDEGRDHARKVGLFVDELLRETGIAPDELDAVAVGKAPIRGCASASPLPRGSATDCRFRCWLSVRSML